MQKGSKRELTLDEIITGQVPPQAIEIEEAILGAIMLQKDALDSVISLINPECFYKQSNRFVFDAILALNKKSEPIDLLTVVEQLRCDEKLEIVGGPYALTKLTNNVVSSAHIERHAQIVFQKYLLRKQIEIYTNALLGCYDGFSDGFEMIDKVESKLTSLTNDLSRGESVSIDRLAMDRVMRIESLRNSEYKLTGVTSGYVDIDFVTGGWQEPDLIILAARPSLGKTAFALNLARNAAMCKRKPTPVAFFSLEMSKEQVTDRLLSMESGISLDKIVKAKMNNEEMELLYNNGLQPLSLKSIEIDDTAALTIFELRAKARRLKSKKNIGLIIVDYLQLMRGVDDTGMMRTRENEISNISRSLKALAKELRIPVIALSQLSRANEKEKRKPTLVDLREGGSIEQDADIVAFLDRPDYLLLDVEVDPTIRGTASVRFAKHRNGFLEEVPMMHDLSIQRWFTPNQYRDYQLNLNTQRGSTMF